MINQAAKFYQKIVAILDKLKYQIRCGLLLTSFVQMFSKTRTRYPKRCKVMNVQKPHRKKQGKMTSGLIF